MVHRRHLRILAPRVCVETVRELEKLLTQAKSGDVVGIAYIAICRTDYTVNAVGQANERPTLARGMIRVLDDLLRDRHRLGRGP